MIEDFMLDFRIDHYKPKMRVYKSLSDVAIIPDLTVAQVKADGEFNYLRYERNGETFTLNKWGRKRMDFPALNELKEALSRQPFTEAELLVELFAMEGDRPLKLPQFIHYVKSKNPQLIEKICIGVWDIISIDGKPVNENHAWKLQEATNWLQGCEKAFVLPYIQPKHHIDLETFWRVYVEKLGYEGLVIRQNSQIYKLKPKGELDAVVIAINKKTSYGKALKLLEQGYVTSLHLALINQNGEYVEIGDVASGIDLQLRKALYQLLDFKIAEDENKIWIKPFLIANVEYTELFPSENKVYAYTPQGYIFKREMKLARLRHPRLIRFRPDKQPTPQDVGLNQIPENALLKGVNYETLISSKNSN